MLTIRRGSGLVDNSHRISEEAAASASSNLTSTNCRYNRGDCLYSPLGRGAFRAAMTSIRVGPYEAPKAASAASIAMTLGASGATKTEKPGDRDRFALAAPVILAEWEARKKRGVLTGQAAMA
jgi:hypothetical protein